MVDSSDQMARCPSCSAETPVGAPRCISCGTNLAVFDDAETVVASASTSRLRSTIPDDGRFPPGTVLAHRYRIAGLVGRGGMGEVYKAADLMLGQTVALKFLPKALASNEAALERFRNEVRVARQVSHANVCRVYDLGEAEGHLFLSMEFVDGEDLECLLRRIGHPPPAKALEMARRICAGLAAAHEKGVLHRDLKPANIMLDGRGQVRIMDFGLAAAANQLAQVDVRSGTPAYMAPEQLSGKEVTALSDMYALGLVLFELFTGAKAFQAESIAELVELQQSGVEVPDGVPQAVAHAIARCLEADPRRRPHTALSVAAALPGSDPLQAALEAGETPSPALVAASGGRTAMPVWAGATCFAVLCAGLLCSGWFGPRGDIFRSMPAELPPDALALRARDHLRNFGYQISGNSAFNFAYAPRLAQPPVIFWYRTGPQPLTPWLLRTMPAQADPPPEPGYVLIQTDTAGRLVLLKALAPDREPPQSGELFDTKKLFDAAGLDYSRFAPATPDFATWSPVDERLAWVEAGEPLSPVKVEAAMWRGRPVLFRHGRNLGLRTDVSASGPTDALTDLFLLVTVLGSTLLAWNNLRLDRGDRRGALRIGLVMVAVLLVAGLLPLGAIAPRDAYNTFAKYAGWCLYWSAITVIPYLAVEPYVRRRWPRVLIGWTRLLQGGWRDPLVGSDVLVGACAGSVMGAIVAIFVHVHGPLTADAAGTVCDLVAGSGKLGTLLLVQLLFAVPVNLLAFFLLFAVSGVTRSRYIGGPLFVVALASMWAAPSAHAALAWPTYLLVGSISLLVFLRFGILAGAAMFLVYQTSLHAPLTLDVKAWYFGESMFTMALMVALGAAALRIAMKEN